VTLDASGSPNPAVTNVSFYLSSSPSFSNPTLIGTVTAETYFGWPTTWNSAALTEGDYTFGDGTYYLESVAAYSGGTSGTSSPVTITINNPPVTLLPENNATASGTVLLDMSVPSGTTYAEWFLILNGIFQGYLVASPSAYGWYLEWNSTTVLNGDYTLLPVAVVSPDILSGSSTSIDVANP
jgi:hypothetical protein